MPVAELLQRHAAEWRRAVCHPFLDAVRDGTLPAPALPATARYVELLERLDPADVPNSFGRVVDDRADTSRRVVRCTAGRPGVPEFVEHWTVRCSPATWPAWRRPRTAPAR